MSTPAEIANKPAFARTPYTVDGDRWYHQSGLTFRELAALHLHSALLTDRISHDRPIMTAQNAVEHADALAAELAKTQK